MHKACTGALFNSCVRKITSIVVLINCFEPANVVVGVRDHVDVDGVVDLQKTRWADLTPPRPIHTGSSLPDYETTAEAQQRQQDWSYHDQFPAHCTDVREAFKPHPLYT